MRTKVLCMMVTLLVVAVACGAPKSGEFTPIERDIPASLTATTTTTTTTISSTTTSIELASTTTMFEPPTSTIVNALVRLYFIAGRDQITPVDVQLARDPAAAQVMGVLEAGPTGQGAAQLRSAIPPGTQSITHEDRGTITVDLPANFFTANEENPIDQRLAVAQIVLTLTQLGGISRVTFTQGGEPIAVFLSDGSVSDVGQELFADDYSALLRGNPPETSTTTTTTTSQPENTTTSERGTSEAGTSGTGPPTTA